MPKSSSFLVADAGPLIALDCIGRVELLRSIAEQILVPEEVLKECTVDKASPGAAEIRMAVRRGVLRKRRAPKGVGPGTLETAVGPGEAEVIRLALRTAAPALIDDKTARHIARQHGVEVIGVGGVLVECKRLGVIPDVGPLLAEIRSHGYYLSNALVSEILRRCGEL